MNLEDSMIVRFWEARVAPGRLDEAVDWVHAHVLEMANQQGALRTELFTADADEATNNPARIVVLMRWAKKSAYLDPVIDTVAIERAHGWDFQSHG